MRFAPIHFHALRLIAAALLCLLPAAGLAADRDGASGLRSSPERVAELRAWLLDHPEALAREGQAPSIPAPAVRQPADDPPLTWTVLFYDDADFPGAYDPLNDFAADARSYPNVNVLVLQDRNDDAVKLWRVRADHTLQLRVSYGELDMGDPATLQSFIEYAQANYPADRTLLALYDHGGGWSGCCWDVTNDGFLRMDDMRQALAATGGVDIVAFTAPCLMGALEAAYEVRDWVDVYIGSEDLSGYAFWNGVMGPTCAILEDSSTLSSEDIALQMLQLVAENTYWPDPWMTMSAVRPGDAAPLAPLFDTLAQYAIPHLAELHDDLLAARLAVKEMGQGYDYDCDEVDICDLADCWTGSDPLLGQMLQDIRDAVQTAVIGEVHGESQIGIHGLSISWPESLGTYNDYYEQVDLDWVADTRWDEFLHAWFDHVPIPVYLAAFTAVREGGGAALTWRLAFGGEPAAFEVWRQHAGRERERIGTCPAAAEGRYAFLDPAPPDECTAYWLRSADGSGAWLGPAELAAASVPAALRLGPGRPNPFNPRVAIDYRLPEAGPARLAVHDSRGRLVAVLLDGPQPAGEGSVVWNGRDRRGAAVASGVYFASLESAAGRRTQKLTLAR